MQPTHAPESSTEAAASSSPDTAFTPAATSVSSFETSNDSADDKAVAHASSPGDSAPGGELARTTHDAAAAAAVAPPETEPQRPENRLTDDVIDFEMCSIRVRCSSCGLNLFASAPKVAAAAFADLGMPPLMAVKPELASRDTLFSSTDNMKICPNCKEASLYAAHALPHCTSVTSCSYDDGIVNELIDAVELYNLRVSGGQALCLDCRETMCDFAANFLAAVHLPPQSGGGAEVNLSGLDSIDLRKIAGCRESLVIITEGGDDDVIAWALHVSRGLRKQFKNLRPSRFVSGGISAFRRVFPGLFSAPITISLPACILSHDHGTIVARSSATSQVCVAVVALRQPVARALCVRALAPAPAL